MRNHDITRGSTYFLELNVACGLQKHFKYALSTSVLKKTKCCPQSTKERSDIKIQKD